MDEKFCTLLTQSVNRRSRFNCSPKQFPSNIFIFPLAFDCVQSYAHFSTLLKNLCPPSSTHLYKNTFQRPIGLSDYAEFFATSSINQDIPFRAQQNIFSEMTFVNDKKQQQFGKKKQLHSKAATILVSKVSCYFFPPPYPFTHSYTFDRILPLIFFSIFPCPSPPLHTQLTQTIDSHFEEGISFSKTFKTRVGL